MNEFIEQFIIESREHVEQATAALLALDSSPYDTPARAGLSRALHTLKGSAGIVDFLAMEQLLHALEDALRRRLPDAGEMSAQLNADCLACLDLTLRWLDTMARTGEIPGDAAAEAALVVARLLDNDTASETGASRAAELNSSSPWLERMLAKHPDIRARTRSALRFVPKPDCFFRGEDPLALIAAVPGLLALDLQPEGEWPPLATLDPYRSFLVYTGLSSASADEIGRHLSAHVDDCEIVTSGPIPAPDAGQGLAQVARAVLAAQLDLLGAVTEEIFAGCVASAGTVAAHVLTCSGLAGAAERVAHATAQSLAENVSHPLRAQLLQALGKVPDAAPAARAEIPARPEKAARTLRIDTRQVETLVRLTGELTVARNAIGHLIDLAQADANPVASRLKDQHAVLDRITGAVQRTVLGMRVLPLRAVMGRFPPVVRDLSASLGKPVKLVIEGDETEADKTIVELLFEPLLHVVRNAMDHGIETADARARSSKPPVSTLAMRAARRGDRVLVEVSDDGGGIDVARIREAAVARGVVDADRLAELTEAEIVDLIFAPGFSTASQVTELSGRGVGMDAVRTAVGRIGGTVSIDSQAGQRTTVRFSLPFSVMMTQVMTVEADGQMFGIPLDAVVETISVPGTAIARIGAAQAIVHRNRTLPILELADLLQVRAPAPVGNDVVIVVTAFAGQWGGIRIDRAGERLDVMLEPLAGLLAGIPGITGTTITGDGRVLLILDMGELLR